MLEATPSVLLDESVRAVRPHIVCCIVSGISFVQHTFKKFIQLQVILNIINPCLTDLTVQGGWVGKVDKSVVTGFLPLPGVHKSCARFCTVVPNILSKIIAVIFVLAFKHVYQFTGTEYKVPGNSEAHTSLQNCGSSAWSLLHISSLACRIWSWLLDFWKICGFL